MKNRAAIYQREAAEMLHNISLYPGLTENQLCRFFPEKEATAKVLLAHMLKEGRVFCDRNGGYYANQEAQNGADKDLSRCVWVLLDFIDQVEYHTVGEFPAAILCFANGELYEIVPTPQGKETMICQLLRQPQKDAGKRIPAVLNENLPLLFILLLWDFFHQIIYTAMQDTCQAQQGFPLRLVNVFLALLILLDGAHGDFCLSCQFRLAHFGQCAQAL